MVAGCRKTGRFPYIVTARDGRLFRHANATACAVHFMISRQKVSFANDIKCRLNEFVLCRREFDRCLTLAALDKQTGAGLLDAGGVVLYAIRALSWRG